MQTPSMQAIRVLVRICQAPTRSTRAFRFSPAPAHPVSRQAPVRHKSTSQAAAARAAVSDRSSASNPIDPQTDASSPILPDVTNYYTLFPETLPHGPPRASTSIPDSSSLTNPSGENTSSLAKFHINPRELRKEFLRLQSQFHPDKYQNGSTAHQRAYALSTLLNNAYKTLSDPLQRAQYLLQLQYGIDVTNEDNSAFKSDADTLTVVMDAQEELEGIPADMGGAEARTIVDGLKEQNDTRIFKAEKRLEQAFESGDKDLAVQLTVELKYWMSLKSGLDEWEVGKEVRLVH